MKKTFSHLLAFLILSILVLSLCVFADGAKYVIDAENGHPGDRVNVDIYLENNQGFGGLAYEVIYDSELLSVVTYEKKLGKSISADSGNKFEGKIVFQYAGITNIHGDDPLVSITFEINKDADAQKAKLSVLHQAGSSFRYGGQNNRTEITFDIQSAEGYINILSDTKKEQGSGTTITGNTNTDTNNDVPPEVTTDNNDTQDSADDKTTSGEEIKSEESEQTKWNNPFSDVSEDDWFYEAVKNANTKGIINGVTETEFAPNQNITRAMFVTMLYRLQVLPRVRMHNFSDVPFGVWYYNPVAWASEEGIVKGITPTEFCPDVGITREQLATMLFRYAVYKGMNAVTMEENLDAFEDSHDISEYAVSALNWAVGQGLINGTTPTTLSPLATATRAQVAIILDRFLKLGI